MDKKAFIVGLSDCYHPVTTNQATTLLNSKLYSSNHGACFITKSLLSIFDADYFDFNKISPSELNSLDYEVCIISLASHLGPNRDLTNFVSFLNKINVPKYFVSGGIDAGINSIESATLSESIIDILHLCSADGQLIGVRGYASAQLLSNYGFSNVCVVGCPTFYSQGLKNIEVDNHIAPQRIVAPFHWNFFINHLYSLQDIKLIGQDCSDIDLLSSIPKMRSLYKKYRKNFKGTKLKFSEFELVLRKNLKVLASYDDWTSEISNSDFVLSGRLHATLYALSHGIPATLKSWDLRTKELQCYFNIPKMPHSIEDINSITYKEQFYTYNSYLPYLFQRWRSFCFLNKLGSYLKFSSPLRDEVPSFEASLSFRHELKNAQFLFGESRIK